MAQSNNKAAVDFKWLVAITLSDILVLVSYFIYVFLPKSEFANSIEHSGMTAVYAMLSAPVTCLIALAVFLYASKKIRPALISVYKNAVVNAAVIIPAILYIISLVLEILFIVSLFELGFAAPMDGTVYETQSVFILVSCIIQLVFWVFISVKFKSSAK